MMGMPSCAQPLAVVAHGRLQSRPASRISGTTTIISGNAMRRMTTTRRDILAGLSGAALAGTANGFGAGVARAAGPVTLNIIDVAGNLQLTQEGIERFRAQHPNLVSR